jgi:poly [ADP-ribose] polymerase
VSLEWLLESKDKKKKMAEKKFLVGDKDSTAQNVPASAPATDSDKKRTASAAVDGVQRPSKKKRDEQKAEEKMIHVPVDEGCKEGGKLC